MFPLKSLGNGQPAAECALYTFVLDRRNGAPHEDMHDPRCGVEGDKALMEAPAYPAQVHLGSNLLAIRTRQLSSVERLG